jgi:HAD superfamily hydrolase (TIGR01509 family)
MGVSKKAWADYTFNIFGGKLSLDKVIEEILKRMVYNYENGNVKILPGANEALEYCSNNYITGLASGSPLVLINAAIKAADWSQYFSKVVSSDEVNNGKPAPDTYLEIFKRLNLFPDETVIVEDSGGGIIAGIDSGAKVIAVPNPELMPSEDILSNAHMCLESLHEIPKAMEELS